MTAMALEATADEPAATLGAYLAGRGPVATGVILRRGW